MKKATKAMMDERIKRAETEKERLTARSKWAKGKHLAAVKFHIEKFAERLKRLKAKKAKTKES